MEEILGKASVMSDVTTVNNSYHNHSDKALFFQMNLGWSFTSLPLSLHIFLLTRIFFYMSDAIPVTQPTVLWH